MTVARCFASLSAVALVATTALAAVPGAAADVIDVSFVNYGQIEDSEIYKADLESIGVGREISGNNVLPLDIFVGQPSPLTFRVLASTPLRRDPTIRTYSFHVDGIGYAVPQMSFDPVGTVLTTQTFAGIFQTSLGFGLDIDDPLTQSVPFDLENEEVRIFIRTSDDGKIEGEDTYIGSFDRLYFEAYGSLFEVSATAVPEPSSWALMVAGFGLVGGAVRRRRQVAA